jgi:hypothetical protein
MQQSACCAVVRATGKHLKKKLGDWDGFYDYLISLRSAVIYFRSYLDIKPINFNVASATPAKFVEDTAVNFVGFKFDIENAATSATGNDITAATGGDNYAVDVYFAQADLKTTPTGTKTAAFSASKTAGDLAVALTAGSSTTAGLLTFTANNVKLPSTNCNLYTWICACVKEGAQATFVDSDTTNNCICSDYSSKISCNPGEHLFYIELCILTVNVIVRTKYGAQY